MPVRTAKLVIDCVDTPECKVNFEPEGAEFTLKVGDHLKAEVNGTGSGEVEVTAYPGGVMIGAWNRAQTTVWNAGASKSSRGPHALADPCQSELSTPEG